ncbi:erythronate-4-phosphate dehydrogenase [Klebsiella pneumoniae]|nr:erythronate-4-phosphate dehydrogenase [Klebsiella pneumoniae]
MSFSSEWISVPRIIAGYTLEGKARGTTQVFEAYSAFIGHPQQVALDTLLPAPEFGRITLHGPLDQPTLKRLVHLVYDVRRDDAPLRKVAGVAGEFDKLRKNYQERREWSSLYVQCSDEQAATLCASSVLTPCIILFVNVFLMPLPDTPAGPLYFWS